VKKLHNIVYNICIEIKDIIKFKILQDIT